MKSRQCLRTRWILVVGTVTSALFAFNPSPMAQAKARDSKLNSQFLDAIRKGDVKKINAIAKRGATVSPPGEPIDDPKVVQVVAGGCIFDYQPKILDGASPTMLAAIESAHAESVRALLGLGFDPKRGFYQGGVPIFMSAMLEKSAHEGVDASIRVGDVLLRTGPDTNGHVASYPCTPVTKVTYLSVAEQVLAEAEASNSKRQHDLKLIVELLTRAANE
jgi:hypothetical protein